MIPDDIVRRATIGVSALYPEASRHGDELFGSVKRPFAEHRLVPPVFTPNRLAVCVREGRETTPSDVSLNCDSGGLAWGIPVGVSALGSSTVVTDSVVAAIYRTARERGMPVCIGENIRASSRDRVDALADVRSRVELYCRGEFRGGGLVVQQSLHDASGELWQSVYSSPGIRSALGETPLVFELKIGQGAKPGLGGMKLVAEVDPARAARAIGFSCRPVDGGVLRQSRPGSLSPDLLKRKIAFIRSNFPDAKIWVKCPPARDLEEVAIALSQYGVEAMIIDGSEGGTGWGPMPFFDEVGLPLVDCLDQVGAAHRSVDIIASGGLRDGADVVKALALGAKAVNVGRAAVWSATAQDGGFDRYMDSVAEEMKLLLSALDAYTIQQLDSRAITGRTK